MTTPTRTPHADPVDADTASLLALIHGDPIHQSDRATVVAAILATARANSGEVCPNRLRALLTNEHGSTVYPPVIGAVVHALAGKGVLRFTGWRVTEDSRTRNNGKPAKCYRLAPTVAAASS